MSKTRVHNLSVSLDGFAAGEPQSLETPMGHAGQRLHTWMFAAMAEDAPADDPDVAYARRWDEGIGAEIMGSNKFGPPGWQDDPDWRGWWGEDPPFHSAVVVLTHRPRPVLEMAGGNTFHFLDASPADALAFAREAAGALDVRIGGGATMVRDFVLAGLVDEMHVAVAPIVLGRGVRLWDGLEGLESTYDVASETTPSGTTHLTFTRRG
jgi:dihydrofolate reductase